MADAMTPTYEQYLRERVEQLHSALQSLAGAWRAEAAAARQRAQALRTAEAYAAADAAEAQAAILDRCADEVGVLVIMSGDRLHVAEARRDVA